MTSNSVGGEDFVHVPLPEQEHIEIDDLFATRFNKIYHRLMLKTQSYASNFFKIQITNKNREIWCNNFISGLPSQVHLALSAPQIRLRSEATWYARR